MSRSVLGIRQRMGRNVNLRDDVHKHTGCLVLEMGNRTNGTYKDTNELLILT